MAKQTYLVGLDNVLSLCVANETVVNGRLHETRKRKSDMREHTHDYVDGRCVICGDDQWFCLWCNHPMQDGETCYLPDCVEQRLRSQRRMSGYSPPPTEEVT